MSLLFTPTPDVAALLQLLLDVYERRGGAPRQAVRVNLDDVAGTLPGYFSQVDPTPRLTANEQLEILEGHALVHLAWQPGQKGHLLDAVTLEPERVERLYALVGREPLARRCERLRALLLTERAGLDGWYRRAVDRCLDQLKAGKSPAPFDPDDDGWNCDLLAALLALPDEAEEEIPYRVFSVRVFNDSKRFDALQGTVARLARRHNPEWRALSDQETLRELGLVANPGHLYLYGPWQLVDERGQVTSLAEFSPSVGIPSALAACVKRVRVDAARVVCVENLTSFYELIRREGVGLAALCLWGNPSPAGRYLLRRLVAELPANVPLLLWADIDCGGLSILAQLRGQVSSRFAPYQMDCSTLDTHARWAHPLSAADERRLARLKRHPYLSDVAPLIDHMLLKGIKLEQEAVRLERG
ncbi:MAG: DUF2399 domain-containing protein [Anaerolineae bacterium]|nr:DUF2399 domain-containing protein [Anaerolineae bacterium]